MNIYFVRHAQSRQNINESDRPNHPVLPEVAEYEENDFSLTAKGHAQADLAGKRLSCIDFNTILCSPMHRTIATANGIVRHQKNNKTIEIINDIVERGIFDYAGIPTEIISKIYPDINIIPCPNPTPTGGKYTYSLDEMYDPAELIKRARRVVKYVEERFEDTDKILIVSHGDFLGRYLIPAFIHMPDDAMEIFSQNGLGCGNASITKVIYNKEKGTSILAFLDDTIHLQEGHETAKVR